MKKLLLLALFLVVTVLLVACATPAAEPTISISEDGYLVVNGTKTEHKVHTEPVISVIDGYVAVNGVKTQYVAVVCEHVWKTVTTPPTCLTNGYDTLTCELCGITSVENKTPTLPHTFASTYTTDEYFHWFKCETCDAKKAKMLHSADENDVCSVCNAAVTPLADTPGVIYDIDGSGTYAEVIGYEGTSTTVKIADTYQGVPVKSIYKDAFKSSDITAVVIGNNVTNIGSYAFALCHSLDSVTIPDSVTTIRSNAFAYCRALTSVIIPNSVTSIEESAFLSCTSLATVTISDNVTSIGNYAFHLCDALSFATYGNCNYLGSANDPYVALISTTNSNLSSYEIHENTKMIADNAFYDCDRLASIEIPDNVTHIGKDAFNTCNALTTVVIGDSVTTIGQSAFSSCNALTSVFFGSNLEQIKLFAFSGCDALTDVYYAGSKEQWQAIAFDGATHYDLANATMHYNYTPQK